MDIDDFLKGLQIEIPEIRFCGVVEKSGHLHAGLYRQGIDEHLKGRNPEISFTQSAYIIDLRRMFSQELGKLESVLYVYEKVKMASIPLREEILVMSTDSTISLDTFLERVKKYISQHDSELDLSQSVPFIPSDKQEIIKNLHDSGISDEMIADQLDLDLNAVKLVIKNLSV
jgi:hypothetical protein